MHDLLARPRPSGYEVILVLPLALLITSFIAVIDITIFDGYVLPDLEECFPSNTSEKCNEMRERFGCAQFDQQCIADSYHRMLEDIVIVFGSILFVLRLVFGLLAGAKPSTMLIFIAFLWFLSGTILFYTGWIDTFYYEFRGLEIPDTLAWLNGIGLFVLVQQFGDDPNMVEKSDLYLLNAIGIISLISLWVWMIYHHKKHHLQRIGIRH